MLTRLIRIEPDRSLKVHAASILARSRKEEESVVPVLVDGILFGDRRAQGISARALTNYPTQAGMHLRELQALASDKDNGYGRESAIDALKILAHELVPKD